MSEITKKDVEMENVGNQATDKDEARKPHKSSFETRMRTQVIESLHLTKKIIPVASTRMVCKMINRKREMVEMTVFTFDARVEDVEEKSIYHGIVVHSYSEQDAINKLNDAIFAKARDFDTNTYKDIYDDFLAKELKKEAKKAKKNGNLVEHKPETANSSNENVA